MTWIRDAAEHPNLRLRRQYQAGTGVTALVRAHPCRGVSFRGRCPSLAPSLAQCPAHPTLERLLASFASARWARLLSKTVTHPMALPVPCGDSLPTIYRSLPTRTLGQEAILRHARPALVTTTSDPSSRELGVLDLGVPTPAYPTPGITTTPGAALGTSWEQPFSPHQNGAF